MVMWPWNDAGRTWTVGEAKKTARINEPLAWAHRLIASAMLVVGAPLGAAEPLVHLRLVDRLDRPQDGYCLDILGTGSALRVDLPLFAHNCKPALTADSAVQLEARGTIRFPAVDRCVTAAGVNGAALPGASVLLRPCDESTPFFAAAPLQRFELEPDGRVALAGSGLCLAVGDNSAPTYSAADRWRVLVVADCERVAPALARWEQAVP